MVLYIKNQIDKDDMFHYTDLNIWIMFPRIILLLSKWCTMDPTYLCMEEVIFGIIVVN